MSKIAIITFGCKVNQYDSSALTVACEAAGYRIVDAPSLADICVVSTCAVTEEAECQAVQKVKSIKKNNPNLKIIIIGCSAELEAKRWSELYGVDFVCGVSDRVKLEKYLAIDLSPAFVPKQTRARYFLKVQDGCDHSCSYCAIRLARGRSRSLDKKWVVEQYKRIAGMGINEVVLTGIHLGDYGRDLGYGRSALFDLVSELLDNDGPRIRLSSLHPSEVSDEIISLFKVGGKLCRHVHLSAQSLADPVLERMNRKYSAGDVSNVIHKLAGHIKGVFIAADIIVGFPGEDEDLFEMTKKSLLNLPLSSLHLFPFSSRKGTQAHDFGVALENGVKKRRLLELKSIAEKKWSEFASGQIGKKLEAVITKARDDSHIECLSDNYLSVMVTDESVPAKIDRFLYGGLVNVVIKNVVGEEVVGKWI